MPVSPSRRNESRRAFTLVELILVLAIMAIMMGVAAPMLSRSLRDRHLEQEGLRLLGMTELCRSLAISSGVPMTFWIDASQGRYGIEPKDGYIAAETATREYALGDDVWVDGVTQASGQVGSTTNETTVEYAPDGLPEISGIETVRLTDKFGGTVLIARTDDGWGYQIVKEAK